MRFLKCSETDIASVRAFQDALFIELYIPGQHYRNADIRVKNYTDNREVIHIQVPDTPQSTTVSKYYMICISFKQKVVLKKRREER